MLLGGVAVSGVSPSFLKVRFLFDSLSELFLFILKLFLFRLKLSFCEADLHF